MLSACFCPSSLFAQNITTIAGGIGTSGTGTTIGLGNPYAIATDTSGNYYIADADYHVVRKITPSGIVSTFAGNGAKGYSGNGGPATMASLCNPMGVATDRFGNVYVSEQSNCVVRKINSAGIITLFAGNDTLGFSGDNGPATNAKLNIPIGICTDNSGNVYIADYSNNRIRKVDVSGTITTFAGNGTAAFSGDGLSATGASVKQPAAVGFDLSGNCFIVDQGNVRIRKVNTSGIISTIAGAGTLGSSPDGTPATAAVFSYPSAVSINASGTVYFTDKTNGLVRYIDNLGFLRTFAGGGPHYPGDGLTADSVSMFRPSGIAFDRYGNLGISIGEDHRVAKVNTSGIFNTMAGNLTNLIAGEGGPATAAQVYQPWGVTVDNSGNIFVSEYSNHIIVKINNAGIASRYAGTGQQGFAGDGGPATAAKLFDPRGVVTDNAGNLFVTDHGNHRIRKIDAAGIISTVAGNATSGPGVDNVPATSTSLNYPMNINLDRYGNLYICDWGHNHIRMVDTLGIIRHIAGCNYHGFTGDGGPAVVACINSSYGICIDTSGNIYFSDADNFRVRMINNAGIINTYAGTGTSGYSGDLGPATAAQIAHPFDMKVGPDGAVYFIDGGNNVVRRIATDHTISTVTGNSIAAFSGDGGPSSAASLNNPLQLAFDPWSNYFIADDDNNRIRKVGNGVPSAVAPTPSSAQFALFPNPSAGNFTIYLPTPKDEIFNIRIIDATGRIVQSIPAITNRKISITTTLPSGTYIVTASTTTNTFHQKLIISHYGK